jgi:hypothetical protein
VFWVISVYFNIRNTLSKSGTFLLGHPDILGKDGAVLERVDSKASLDTAQKVQSLANLRNQNPIPRYDFRRKVRKKETTAEI